MKIAVTSQNFRTVTPHAGRTRRFLLYNVAEDGTVAECGRLDLPRELAMHEFRGEGSHPLDDVDVIIAGSFGEGFARRLAARGIHVVATDQADPLAAVRDYLAQPVRTAVAQPVSPGHRGLGRHQHQHHHAHRHQHQHREGCGHCHEGASAD